MVIFDTNMILRYLLDDDEQMANVAERCLYDGDVFVSIEVIAEVVYVLRGVYSLEREEIVDTVKGFLELVDCQEMDVLNIALATYGKHGLDFVDCVLYSYYKVRGAKVATFDKKLLKLMLNESL